MDYAREYVQKSRRKRQLARELDAIKRELDEMEAHLLELMESEQLPESFKIDGASIYTRSQIWASPADGDHDHLASVLQDVGLYEYLPSKVNSQSISAYVREHINKETGEIEGLDPRLMSALKITENIKAVVIG